jgi:hypothetical protein
MPRKYGVATPDWVVRCGPITIGLRKRKRNLFYSPEAVKSWGEIVEAFIQSLSLDKVLEWLNRQLLKHRREGGMSDARSL